MAKYKILKCTPWQNKPTTSLITAESIENQIHTLIYDECVTYNKSETDVKPKITYICKNCNGHINPATMKCEYCDTQY